MAYVTKDVSTRVRQALKGFEKPWKFSVTGTNTSTLKIAIMQYPGNFSFPDEYVQFNLYHLRKHCAEVGLGEIETLILEHIHSLMSEDHWDKSDLMTDYFHCSFYMSLDLGKWNKPAKPVYPK